MMRPILLSFVLATLAVPALADGLPDNSATPPKSFTLGDYGARARRPPPPAATTQDPSLIHRQAERWPWLEAGTVVCSTEDDLQRYHATIAARLAGQQVSGTGGDCRRLTQRTPIDIAARRGPASTEILLNSDSRQAAWTDVWLPAQRPN